MTPKTHARRVLATLRTVIPQPETELTYRKPFELLVAVILSAQCTDERVNKVTPALFEAYPTAAAMAGAAPEDIFPYIRSISYPNNKARHLAGMAQMLVADFDGAVPSSLDALVKLPGVGRKTAQVVASVAFDVAALPVDTHVFRVANRIGLAEDAPTPLAVERQLKARIPEEEWGEAHHLLILHGRYTCTARAPKCTDCPLPEYCAYYAALQRLPGPVQGLEAKRGTYFCNACGTYFNKAAHRTDAQGLKQTACPACTAVDVYRTKTGITTQKAKDFRV